MLDRGSSCPTFPDAPRFLLAGIDRLRCDVRPLRTDDVERSLALDRLTLSFLVSRDEEYVRLSLLGRCLQVDLGDRDHNFLLLTLARYRLADAADGFADGACGWVHVSDLSRDPSMAPPRLDLNVFRIRKHFGGRGVANARAIVERRRSTREIRLGTARIQIATL